MPVKRIIFDQKSLKDYFFSGKTNMFYKKCVEKMKDFLPHSDGAYPADIIDRQRPNEPDVVKEFRKEIWQPITKPKFSQIISSLGKIRRSSDWSVKHPDSAKDLSKVTEEETLENYSEVDYPFFGSITNWVFSVLMKVYLTDPNAVLLVMPLDFESDQTEYIKPFPFIFDCSNVLDFVPEQYAILRDPNGSERYDDGVALFVITTDTIERWEQVSAKSFTRTFEHQHGLDRLPAFKLGGIIVKSFGHNFLYESRIAGVLPNLNEAVAEYTDLQAAKRLHVYPERWEYSQHECPTCKGSGQVRNKLYVAGGDEKSHVTCPTCNGISYISGPYSKLIVKPATAGNTAVPNPPAGFIEKDVEIVKIMDEGWRKHIYDALAAINFQFLDQSPLNQSGVAKEVDKEELNNTVHAIAEDIVRIMDELYRLTAYYRYKALYSFEQIDQVLPSIAVPDHFDLLSSQFMQEEVNKAKSGKLNPVIVSAMEIEYSGKRFINEPEVKDRLELILKLDPLPNITEDDKMSMLSNKGITLTNYVITSNIQSFVQRALDEHDDFAILELPEQLKILKSYAEEQINESKAEADEAMQRQREMMGRPEPEGGRENQDEEIEEPILENG